MLTPEGHVQQPPIPVRQPSQAYVRNSVVSNSGLPVGFVPVSVTPTASPVLFDTTSGSGPTGEVPLGFIPAGVPVAFPDGITTVASPTRSNNLEHSQSRHSLHSRHGSTHSLSSSLRRVGPTTLPLTSSPLRQSTADQRAPSRTGSTTPVRVESIYGPPTGHARSKSRSSTVYPSSPSVSMISGVTNARGVPLPASVYAGSVVGDGSASRPASRHSQTPYRRPTEGLYDAIEEE